MSKKNQSEDIYDRDDLHRDAKRVFRESEKAAKNADVDKPVSVFGMEVDAGLAAYITSIYNIAAGTFSGVFTRNSYDLTHKLLSPHASAPVTLKAAALASTAVNVALKSGGYIMPVIKDIRTQREDKSSLARRVASVLDEEAGKHSVGALKAVAKENTVLKAHLSRMDKKSSVTNWNNLIDLGGNAGPNLLLDFNRTKAMFGGEHPFQYDERMKAAKPVSTATNDNSLGGDAKKIGTLFMQGGPAVFTDRLKKSNLNKLNKNQRPYSALEMILTLDDQLQGGAKARTYQMPGKRGDSYSLEEYIARVVIHHYAEMADISPDYSEVREALHEELAQSVKPIAEALRKGDLSPMELVRLVGEEKIVKKGGRVIASVEEIQTLVGQESHSSVNRVHESPKDHYAKASYNPGEFKKALQALEGRDKEALAALVSDEVLEDAGMKKADIKELHDHKDHDRDVAAITVGTAAQGLDALKEGGTAEKEAKEIEAASKKIMHGGLAAVKTIKSNAANENGIEHALLNAAVPRILEDKSYLGTIVGKGRDLLANDNEANDNERPRSHRERLHHERAVGQDFSADHER